MSGSRLFDQARPASRQSIQDQQAKESNKEKGGRERGIRLLVRFSQQLLHDEVKQRH